MDFSKPDLLRYIPTIARQNGSGWHTFNAPCCHHRGHRPDTKKRGGIKMWSGIQIYNCFNCGFKCGLQLGQRLTSKTKQFLSWCGLDEDQILQINFESMRLKDDDQSQQEEEKIDLEARELPEGECIDRNNTDHERYIEYLTLRGLDPFAYPYMVNPKSSSLSERERIVIPFTHEGKVIGWSARNFSGKPKYINSFPSGYVFGLDLQKSTWAVTILVEGIFDALAIDGVSVLSNNITDRQAKLLAMHPTEKIYVPDHDQAGLMAVDRAIELGYKVSIPDWPKDIKDVNDAVKRWGKGPTLWSIIQSATTNRAILKIKGKKYGG